MYLNADKGNKEHRTKCVCKAIHLYHLFFYGFKRARKQCSIWYPSDGGYFPASCFSLRYGNFFCNKKNRTSIKVPRPDGSVINMEEKGSTVVSREIRKMAHQSPPLKGSAALMVLYRNQSWHGINLRRKREDWPVNCHFHSTNAVLKALWGTALESRAGRAVAYTQQTIHISE